MLFRPRTLSVVTTLQCTAACDHCCFSCTPKMTKRIPRERITQSIDDVATIPSMRHVVFTGGECFLLGNELLEHIAHAASFGFLVRCVSNGYWAVNEKGARQRLEPLVAAGLRSLVVSTGGMHARFVPIDRVRMATRVAAELGCSVTVTLETFVGSDIDRGTLMQDAAFAAMVDAGKIVIDESPWVPETGGNGTAELSHLQAELRFRDESAATRCGSILDTISITPNMNVNACCGFPMEHFEELRLGSLDDGGLLEVINASADDFLRVWIHVDGPERILRFVQRHDPGFELPLDAAHICSSCAYLLGSKRAMEIIGRHYHEIEDRVVDEYLALLRAQEMRLRAHPRRPVPSPAAELAAVAV